MRTVKGSTVLLSACGLIATFALLAGHARADVVTEKGASILVFPKVIANGEFDTVIQISNIANNLVHARCFYVDAQLPQGCSIQNDLDCQPQWSETDFEIWLTKQQPTHWRVSHGRPIDPTDNYAFNVTVGAVNQLAKPAHLMVPFDGAGLDPGAIPPTPEGFTGELKCVQVMADGTPIGANSLKGEATLVVTAIGPNYGDVSKYNAIGIQGTEAAAATCGDPTQDCVLQLNNPRGTTDGEYNACPATLVLNHLAAGVDDPVAGGSTNTQLTLVPCSEDFQTQTPSSVVVQFLVYNEFENRFSTSTTVTCWANIFLTDIDSPNNPDLSVFSANILGSTVAQTRMNPADPTDGTFNGAVIGVAQTYRTCGLASPYVATTAQAIHTEGDRFTGTNGGAFDQIVLPRLF